MDFFAGCPIRHEIVDNVKATAYGLGLKRGLQDKIATFDIDAKGQRGDLIVKIDGRSNSTLY